MIQLTFICIDTVPQLSTHNSGIIIIQQVKTTHNHSSPHSIDADLHSASTLHWSINQTNRPISATLGSCDTSTFKYSSSFII